MSSYCHSTLSGVDGGRGPVTSPSPLAPLDNPPAACSRRRCVCRTRRGCVDSSHLVERGSSGHGPSPFPRHIGALGSARPPASSSAPLIRVLSLSRRPSQRERNQRLGSPRFGRSGTSGGDLKLYRAKTSSLRYRSEWSSGLRCGS